MSSDGSLFVMGRDFRPMISGDNDGGSIYGIPKYIKMTQKVQQIALGSNHMMLMTVSGNILGIGSN